MVTDGSQHDKTSRSGTPPKALLTATVLSHIAHFHEPAIALLKDAGYEVHVAGSDDLAQRNGLTLTSPDKIFEVALERNPLSLRNLRGLRQLRTIIRDGSYDIIHCNTPVAGILTRLVSQRARAAGTRIVYTAHGFHFFEGAPLLNWLLYYPLERAFARLTDMLVTINHEDYQRAVRFRAREVMYMPGVGVDIDRFRSAEREQGVIRRELEIAENAVVVLSVGELNDNKNHRTVLHALALCDHTMLHYVICGNGPRLQQLKDLAYELGLGERVHILGFRRDIPDMLAAADIFCMPSIREGLGVAVIEAMAAGKPVVGSRTRGPADLIDEGRGGVLVRSVDAEGFAHAFELLAVDGELREAMGKYNRQRVESFSMEAATSALAYAYGLSSANKGETL